MSPTRIAWRRESLLRQIGYAIVNRRLQRLSRLGDPPFRDAGLGTGDIFEVGRTTNLIVDTVDGKWQRGLTAAAVEYRRALRFGFAPNEVAEQIANYPHRAGKRSGLSRNPQPRRAGQCCLRPAAQ